ncbi:MAG: cell surface polysaccharide biosynthesis protein [Candidatus Hydrogenedentota bacterium]
MNVPLLDLKAQYKSIEHELKPAVLAVLESTHYIMGASVSELEKEVADYVGAAHGIGVSSGTDALLVALMALEIGPGDLVITTPYSFFATAGAICRMGATPVLVDIRPDSYNLDPVALRDWFDSHSDERDKVKAIIPVHLYGQAADMDPIQKLAVEYGARVIEDAAQAIGTRYPAKSGSKRVGSLGAVGCFSFFPSKNLGGIGDGGLVTCNDDAIADKIRILRNHGAEPKYYHRIIGGNFRLDAIQAAALRVKLKHLDSWHAMRQDNAAYYDANLNVAGVRKPVIAYSRKDHIYNQYVISVPERRDDLRKHLSNHNVGNEVYYPVPFHLQECFAYLGYRKGQFPNSEYAADHTIAIPIYPELTRPMQDYVIHAISTFYS